jgi:tetratricopeptide (TPR) repeat protein
MGVSFLSTVRLWISSVHLPVSDLADLLILGDMAQEGGRMAIVTLRKRAARVTDTRALLDAASQFLASESIVAVLVNRALTIDPDSEEAWEVRVRASSIHDPMARRPGTRRAIQRLLELAPRNRIAVRQKLRVLTVTGDDQAAIAAARDAIRLDPSFVEAVSVLARMLARTKSVESAILELRRFKERMMASRDDQAAWAAREVQDLERKFRRGRGGSA